MNMYKYSLIENVEASGEYTKAFVYRKQRMKYA